jgi:hypothetical protein
LSCSLLSEQKFKPYWVEAGMPGFLLRVIGDAETISSSEWDGQDVAESKFQEIELDTLGKTSFDTTSLMFQTGYLTIKSQRVDENQESFVRLEMPNFEVQRNFLPRVQKILAPTADVDTCRRLLQREDNVGFFLYMSDTALASIPSRISSSEEKWSHSIFHVMLQLLGYPHPSEAQDASGQTDLTFGNCIAELKAVKIGPKGGLSDYRLKRKEGERQVRSRIPATTDAERLVVIVNSSPPRTVLQILRVPISEDESPANVFTDPVLSAALARAG